MIVKVEGLLKRFDSFKAVDNIALSIKKGEVFGFLGPNGAGKTTTIRMLCGLLKPTAGKGTVCGLDIMKDTEKIKEKIGYMSQKFSLYPDLTVGENIDFYLGIYRIPKKHKKKRKDFVLELSQLEERKDEITGQLPLGFRQRLALGCAILHKPEIIFLDEPTAGVDPIIRRHFWNIIEQMSKNGATVFVTTHYMDEAEYCHRLCLIYRGKIIAQGAPRELKGEYAPNNPTMDQIFIQRILDEEKKLKDQNP